MGAWAVFKGGKTWQKKGGGGVFLKGGLLKGS